MEARAPGQPQCFSRDSLVCCTAATAVRALPSRCSPHSQDFPQSQNSAHLSYHPFMVRRSPCLTLERLGSIIFRHISRLFPSFELTAMVTCQCQVLLRFTRVICLAASPCQCRDSRIPSMVLSRVSEQKNLKVQYKTREWSRLAGVEGAGVETN